MQKSYNAVHLTCFIDQGKNQIELRDNVKGYAQGLNADMVYYDKVTK